ncbi:MAG: hypothetical protein WC632_03425 [Candidatus Margulisiibacteriota bacterium]
MSDFSDGIANVSALTTQINQLKESGQTTGRASGAAAGTTQADINASLLDIEKGFSALLDNLMYSADDKKKSEDKYDPFSALESYNQATGAATTSSNSTTGTSQVPNANIAPSSATNPALNYINVPDLDLTI